MPYVITTTDPQHDCLSTPERCQIEPIVSHRAVATLEDARETARSIACGAGIPKGFGGYSKDVDVRMVEYGLIREAIARLPESGGTVGPLPDGTVIEVERVSWGVLASRAAVIRRESERSVVMQTEIVDAYNSRQA